MIRLSLDKDSSAKEEEGFVRLVAEGLVAAKVVAQRAVTAEEGSIMSMAAEATVKEAD